MSLTSPTPAANLGFLTVLHEASGYVGGLLVTNLWGRPLEFRLSTAVQPNRVQQILYGGTLQPYICGELIGKTLVEKTSAAVQLVLTDREPVLEMRQRVEFPVIWVAPPGDPRANEMAVAGMAVRPAPDATGALVCHPRFPGDTAAVRELLDRLDGGLDLAEPFSRIREAIAEARKFGATQRN